MRLVEVCDEIALELDIWRFERGRPSIYDRYSRMYDARRVKRAYSCFARGWHKLMPAHVYLRLPRSAIQ